MAATEADAAPAVQEDGKSPESERTEAEQPAEKDGAAVNSEAVPTEETAENAEEAGAAGGDSAPPQSAENHEHKTSFLDSFLNKSGLGKVMSGRKKKEDGAAEGTEKDAENEAAEPEAEAAEKALENGEKDEEKKSKESKSSVRDLIRKPVAKIFSHRSAEKKDGSEAPKPVRSRSLDRLEDPQALSTEEADGGAEGGAEAETEAEAEQKASSSSATKHMKRWHSFKKLMAQKTHKRSVGEEGADGEGGGDSSTLDSKESGQKRWKLKRSWTFQGLKRDPSVVGISGKTKSGEKEQEAPDGEEEGGEGEKAEGSEEDKAAAAGGTVTQHANEIWTSFKKRVIPKSKRANTECQPGGEDDANAGTASGEDGATEDGKDAKSAKAKRSHFGRAVSLKNFILRKGKSTSVDMGDAAKEEEATPAEEGGDGDAGGDGEGDGEANKPTEAGDAGEASESVADDGEARQEAEKTPVANGENGCENGTAEDDAHDERPDREEENSPLKKSKEVGGAKEETNAKVINAAAPPVNSDKKAGSA
ncbi:sodium/potassium/calcium exchanger 1 [Corythoichthys intestinalis]|uniref:sodium/potassium/calcium exchanger 1 n=1 Tax=Corythoichthys intestinalis TaxID=161448 RepID=UPI0025A5D17E|nr:sodium/potassium/calcium exchanger 1 [Corythoichthys intestinalis]